MTNLNVEALKSSIKKEIERRSRELSSLSLKIHAHPELGYEEVKAAAWLSEYLEKRGFAVERGIYGLSTAFRARYGTGRPAIALLAEYDALPGVGHACGHNLIAGCAVGGAVSSRLAVDRLGGSVLVFGTPAEELFGGKMVMVNQGAFNDVDAVMMVHPGSHNIAVTEALACVGLDVKFFGKSAHASAQPEQGINALEAMILSFNSINSLRQHIRSSARIHGIITEGGEAANVVPAFSAGTFIVRACDDAYLDILMARTLDCFTGAAVATGARLEYRWSDLRYAPIHNNLTLARLFRRNLQSTGRRVYVKDPSKAVGSTDMGNVTQVVPGIHPNVAIAPEDVLVHSPEFAAAASSDAGIEGMLDAARALAGTVVDLLSSPATVKRIRQEFTR